MALELARALGRLPKHIVVYAIEGQCFDPGGSMTAEVAAAAVDAVARVGREIRQLQAVMACPAQSGPG